MLCSGCWPTLCSTSSWRTDRWTPRSSAGACRWLARLRPLLIGDRARAGLLLRARTTPTRASSRRSSTSTCRSRSWRWSASSPPACSAIMHLRTRDDAWDARSYVAIHMSVIFGVGVLVTGAIWAQGELGQVVGLGRADAGQLPDRLPALRDLLPAALLDRGPRAPRALLVGVRDHRGRVRADQLPRGAAGREPRAPARAERRPPATCPARCGSPSWSRWPAIALLYVTLVKLELTSKHARGQIKRLRRLLEDESGRRGRRARRRSRPCRRGRTSSSTDARASARRGREVRRRRLRRLRRADPRLRRDHGRASSSGSSAS